MNCPVCGRELKEDSKFCDWCGSRISPKSEEKVKSSFNTQALLLGIIISILITLIVTGTAQSLGIPLFFGGLFLPFFWWKIKKQ